MNTRLVIGGVDIALGEDIPVPVTYSTADIKNPQNRKRNSSKTIKAPGKSTNMAYFSSAYQISITELEAGDVTGFEFDPTIRIPAQYYRNGRKIFDGLAQLIDVVIDKGEYTFEILLFSNFVDLFQALGDRKLAELGWSEYDHPLSVANIEGSWDTQVIQNGTPVSNFTGGVPDGFGYLYPIADYGYLSNLRTYPTNNIFPHVYAKEVVEKCLAVAGMTIDSNFFDSERFKRIVIGFGGGDKITISPAEVAARRVDYTATGTYATTLNYTSFNHVQHDFTFPNHYTYFFQMNQRLRLGNNFWAAVVSVFDSLGQFDPTTGEITVERTGNYTFNFDGDFAFTTAVNGPGIIGNSLFWNFALNLFKNDSLINNIYTGLGSGGTTSIDSTVNLDLTVGDRIRLEINPSLGGLALVNSTEPPSGTAPTLDFQVTDSGGWEFDFQSVQAPVIDGDTIYVANYLPDIKCSDLLKGIITMFNLYIDDPDEQGVVKIEPLEDYYFGTGIFDDWTQKVDRSKEIKVLPASSIEGKVYAYRWAKDDDYYNKIYRDQYGIGYGDYNYQVPSTFQMGERVFEVPFAQTTPVEVPGTNIIVPTIIKVDEATAVVTPFKGKARIYIYQGLITSDSWELINSDTLASTTYLSYPACSHVDDYINPDFDLNFGVPIVVNWTATAYTSDNLWNLYNEKFVREITGKDSKILRLYVLLDDDDLQPGSFRRLKMINGTLFRLNEIKDYAANGEQVTQCELVRIVAADKRAKFNINIPSRVIISVPLFTGGDDMNGADTNPEVISGGKDSVEVTSNIRYGG